MRMELTRAGRQAATRRQLSRAGGTTAWYIIVILLCVGMLLPLLWMLTIALKGDNDIYRLPPQFFPSEFHWNNFIDGIQAIHFERLFFNSVVITLLNTIGSVISSTIVGYGLSRIRFVGRRVWFYIFVGSMMLPGIVSLIPMFRLYLQINMYDTWFPLFLPAFFGNPLFIFLARQFYLTIPYSLDEAARIDGAGHFTIFTKIMLPLTRPVWITMAIMAFTATWNDYLNPLVYLYSDTKWTLSLGMASFAGAFAGVTTTKWNQYMATNLLYMLPPLIIFFVAQRYFMQGLSALGTSSQNK
ncbi:carbohydrate ABC transporter permease [Ktedonosporobacter rubrisoli]|uniref:Carbohydrate ABC transporter permease n=1 Tax=Ktedonosporobacter rubrisoli TaxID=2509675 RepID=A0A4P6JL90_KTERU|nr:carbohydrate ABC transporter permease [Ktedonosporobacter rubrisoli]QBD75997.1 carbohydrate ABC transporter permease [Ktedonosporobacter rubrisoli]